MQYSPFPRQHDPKLFFWQSQRHKALRAAFAMKKLQRLSAHVPKRATLRTRQRFKSFSNVHSRMRRKSVLNSFHEWLNTYGRTWDKLVKDAFIEEASHELLYAIFYFTI